MIMIREVERRDVVDLNGLVKDFLLQHFPDRVIINGTTEWRPMAHGITMGWTGLLY